MNATTAKVGYRLVRNATSTAAKAPCLGVAVPVGSLACGDILDRMLDRGLIVPIDGRENQAYFKALVEELCQLEV